MARKARRQASKKKAPATKSKTSRKKAAARSAASKTKVKVTKPSAARDPLDAFIDAAALSLALSCDPAWLPAIKMNLEVILRQAALVDEFALPDETEPAPVFEA
jgi:1-carboxybiuret hydrolase subunit AtzG-like protein